MSDIKFLSDLQLVEALSAGSDKALNEIFNRYWEQLFKFADKLVCDEDVAKDLVQEVMVSLWERRREVVITNLNAYLKQSIRYQLSSHIRKGKFNDRYDDHLKMVILVNNTEESINYNELHSDLLKAIRKLPSRCGEIFYQSRFENLSNKEISKKFNISIRTVETQISCAIKVLRKEFNLAAISLFLIFIDG